MRTKKDVELMLLSELDEICSQNDLNYILIENTALDAYLNHSIKNESSFNVEVAMTYGDIKKFIDIISKKSNRYIEGIFNNPNITHYFISYGDVNTANFRIIDSHKKIHHGINIHIHIIRKSSTLNNEPISEWTSIQSKQRKIHELINKRVINNRLILVKWGLAFLRILYNITGGGNYHYYRKIIKNTYVDNWSDIKNYSKVKIKDNEYETGILMDIDQVNVDNLNLYIPKNIELFLFELFGDDYKNTSRINEDQNIERIIDTENSYKKIIEETKDNLNEVRKVYETVIWDRLKVKNESKSINNIWKLVEMTDKQIQFIEFFEENGNYILSLDLDDKKQYDKLKHELKPIIATLNKYAKYNMSFSINPEIDELIDKILIKEGKRDFVEKINILRHKEYFVE